MQKRSFHPEQKEAKLRAHNAFYFDYEKCGYDFVNDRPTLTSCNPKAFPAFPIILELGHGCMIKRRVWDVSIRSLPRGIGSWKKAQIFQEEPDNTMLCMIVAVETYGNAVLYLIWNMYEDLTTLCIQINRGWIRWPRVELTLERVWGLFRVSRASVSSKQDLKSQMLSFPASLHSPLGASNVDIGVYGFEAKHSRNCLSQSSALFTSASIVGNIIQAAETKS